MPKGFKGFQKGHGLFDSEDKRRRKISESMKGRIPKNFKEAQKKAWEAKRGIPVSEETKERNRQSHLGRKYKEMSIEGRKNISEAHKGKKLSEQTRRKLSELYKGKKCRFWKGGITKKNIQIRNSLEYKLWREAVFKRDNWTCIWCKQRGVNLNADHIKPFAYYPELRFAIDNGRTLCVDCHKKTDTFKQKQ